MTRVFRCRLVLMILGSYAYGDHVRDPKAFIDRCRAIPALRRRAPPTDPHKVTA